MRRAEHTLQHVNFAGAAWSMDQEYSKVGTTLKPVVLTDEIHLAMGRLIRAFAEIEDIISLHLCNVADITEGQLLFLLGKAGIQDKLAKAEALAKAQGGEVHRVTVDCFDNDVFRAMLRCRNVVAHGLLLGQTEAGKIAFRTSNVTGVDSIGIGAEVATYDPTAFRQFADIADSCVEQIEGPLRVKELRDERRARPRRSSQGPADKSAKRKTSAPAEAPSSETER